MKGRLINSRKSICVINAKSAGADVQIYAHTKDVHLCYVLFISRRSSPRISLSLSLSLGHSLQMNPRADPPPFSLPIFPFRRIFYSRVYRF